MYMKILAISLGGAAGALCRHWLAVTVQRMVGPSFPAGTFMVNMLGCLLFGIVWGYIETKSIAANELRLLALTGFLGSFTTFSTYMFETAQLVKIGQITAALLNVAGQSLLGLAFVLAGIALGKML